MREERHSHSDIVLDRLIDEPTRFAVPDLFAYELLAVLHRIHPTPQRVYSSGVIPLLQNGMLRYPMTANIAMKASRYCGLGLTGYDAVYTAVAEELGGLWLTFDTKAHEKLLGQEISHDLSSSLPENLT